MLISDLFEASGGPHEVYHWTNAAYLSKILSEDCINIGASTHKLGGKTLHGVSLTRDPFLDLTNTYAVSGRKAWRIGIDYNKLRHNLRVIPIRDEYLRSKPRGVQAKQKNSIGLFGPSYDTMVNHDECEEFALGAIEPLSRYITSIGYDDAAMDFTVDPKELREDPDYYEDEHDYEADDCWLMFSLVQELHPEFMEYHKRKYPKLRFGQIHCEHVPLICVNREYGTQKDFVQANQYILDSLRKAA